MEYTDTKCANYGENLYENSIFYTKALVCNFPLIFANMNCARWHFLYSLILAFFFCLTEDKKNLSRYLSRFAQKVGFI